FSTAFMRFARRLSPHITRIGVEPRKAPSVWLRKYGVEAYRTQFRAEPEFSVHQMPGAGAWNISFPFLDPGQLDDICLVGDDLMIRYRRLLATAGISVGTSTAACLLASIICGANSAACSATRLTPLYEPGELYYE